MTKVEDNISERFHQTLILVHQFVVCLSITRISSFVMLCGLNRRIINVDLVCKKSDFSHVIVLSLHMKNYAS